MASSLESASAHAISTPSFVTAKGGTQAWGERLIEWLLLAATLLSGGAVILVFVFVLKEALPAIQHNGWSLITTTGWDGQLRNAFYEHSWTFGLLELIVGTTLTTVGALVLTLVIGLSSAIVLVEYAPENLARPFESVVRLLAGFPSVVFGLVGMLVLAQFISDTMITDDMRGQFQFISTGQTLLAAIIVLTFMIMPFFVSVAVDSLRAVPNSYRLAGYALGMPKWSVATRLVLPSASAGILAGLVLAAARGVGEAVAMAMVSGATAHIPQFSNGLFAFFEPVRTLAASIIENGDAASNQAILSAMYVSASLILATSLVLSIVARLITNAFMSRMRMLSERSA